MQIDSDTQKSGLQPKTKFIMKSALSALLLLVFCWITLIVHNGTFSDDFVFTSVGIANTVPVGEITESTVIKQNISLDTETNAIGFLMATYARKNDGKIAVHIVNRDTGNVLYDSSIKASAIPDNASYGFAFDNNQTAQNLTVTISGVNTKAGSSPTIWMSSSTEYGDLRVNGEEVSGTLVYQTAEIKNVRNWKMFANRMLLILLFFIFLALHIFIDYKKIYEFIFSHRVSLTILFILFFVINKYHFSSITQFDAYIQPGTGSEFVEPIFGHPQAIRSDEWLVSTPSKLSAQYSDYDKYNYILRAEKIHNISATGLYKGYSGLAYPLQWGFYFLGSERGYSLMSASMFFLTILFSFEMCYILSRKSNRVAALLGACLISFSSFNVWWSYVAWVLSAQASIVLLYYFFNASQKTYRVLFGLGTALFASFFIVALYPAWQVPVGYLFLMILIWVISMSWENIKNFKAFDVSVFIICILFMLSIVATYLLDLKEYMSAIMATEYPGRRYSYGGFALDKIANYIPAMLFSFRDVGNPSELSIFVSFFPIPILLNSYYMIKSRKINPLALSMIVLSVVFSVYCLVEWPQGLATITLLNYSIPHRLADIIAFIQIYLLIIALSHYDYKRINLAVSFSLSTVIIASTVFVSYKRFPAYISRKEIVLIGVGLIFLLTVLLAAKKRSTFNLAAVGLMLILVASSLPVNPLVRSFDVIYTKPISYQISRIVENDPDAKWIAEGSLVDSGFLVANGAPTINSVNNIPNFELWEKIDPSGDSSYSYNRYAHLVINVVDEPTKIELVQADLVSLNLNHNDLIKTNAKYLVSSSELNSTKAYDLDCLYNEYGKYIYEIEYSSNS